MQLDYNASWWNPDIKTWGLPSVNPTTTKQVLVSAVTGQHIVLAGFSMNDKNSSASTWVALELWWGAASKWVNATSEERVHANFHQLTTASVNGEGWGHMNPVIWPLGVGPVSPVNTPLNVRTEVSNAGGALLYNVTCYMVDSTTLRPV